MHILCSTMKNNHILVCVWTNNTSIEYQAKPHSRLWFCVRCIYMHAINQYTSIHTAHDQAARILDSNCWQSIWSTTPGCAAGFFAGAYIYSTYEQGSLLLIFCTIIKVFVTAFSRAGWATHAYIILLYYEIKCKCHEHICKASQLHSV